MCSAIVIVGHGGAGLAAAIAAREEAASLGLDVRVQLVERGTAQTAGGNTRWSPSYMRMASTRSVAPGFEDDLMLASHGRADREYVQALAVRAPETVQWIEGHGVAFHRPVYYLSEGPPRIQPIGGGVALVETLAAVARSLGVQFSYECVAENIVRTPNAPVSGMTVRAADGAIRTLDSDAAVLACGGFSGNPQMLREHFGPGAESMRPISPGTQFNTGAGIRMALAVGARASGDWAGMHAEPVDARSQQSAPVVLVYPYGIVVDRSGARFFDEGAGLVHETWETFARSIHIEVPGRRAFAILDSRLFEIDGYQRAIRSEQPPVQAETIEQLAALAGIDADGLSATIAAYNRAATGDASRFNAARLDGLRAAESLVPPKSNWARAIDRPPYLCYPLVGAIAYTFGGLATTPEAEVLGEHGPIPGLYAAGEITGHFHGLAPNAVAVMRALVFGRIAGINAVRYLAARRPPR